MPISLLLRLPVYALASLISLFSLDAAYWIDVGRDLYEVRRAHWDYMFIFNYNRLSLFTVSLIFS